MSEEEREIARSILEKVGGVTNIDTLQHCMTRIRLTLHDPDRVKEDEIRAIPGVAGIVHSSNQLQIILGPGTAAQVAREMAEETGLKLGEVRDPEAEKQDRSRGPVQRFLRKLANIFVPLIPAIIAGGIIMGLTNTVVYSFDLDQESTLVLLLNAISKVVFTYLAVFVGINTAREFGGTPALGGVAGGLIILPEIADITLFGTALVPGRGGLIGALLAAWFISLAERNIRRFVPKVIDIMVTPPLALLVTGVITYLVLQPIGGWISDGITQGLTALMDKGGIVAGAVLAGTFLPLVMTGLHHGLIPIHMELLNKTGLDPLWTILAMAGAGQVGAALAVYVKTRSQTLKNVIKGAVPVGMLGIGEPLIFGVTLPLGRPFVTACLGAAVGGAFQAALNTATVAIGISGIPAVLLMQPGQSLLYLLGVLIAYVAGFAFTYLFGFHREMDQNYESQRIGV
ncbi:PTS transporter subunit EIIC [Planifilum fimeticola]